jgi:hypothetical protein
MAVLSRSGAPVPSKSRAPVSQSRPLAAAGAAINAGNLCATRNHLHMCVRCPL